MKQINKNVPNIISAFRLFCTPIMVLLFLLPIPKGIGVFVALGIFILGSISDMVDGYLARKYNLVSDLGKLLDSIADKFLQTAGLILVVMSEIITPQWIATTILLVIILRDILINAIRQIGATKGVVIAADVFGKVKSIFIDVAVIILMLYVGLISVLEGGESAMIAGMPVGYISTFGFSLLVVGVCLSVLSCINYVCDNWSVVLGSTSATKTTEGKEEVAEVKEEQQASTDADNKGNNNDFDELMPQALKLCIETGGATINMIQRRFRVGYARAARIIDQMELAGFVSPGNGTKLRTVYITMEQFNEMFGDGN